MHDDSNFSKSYMDYEKWRLLTGILIADKGKAAADYMLGYIQGIYEKMP